MNGNKQHQHQLFSVVKLSLLLQLLISTTTTTIHRHSPPQWKYSNNQWSNSSNNWNSIVSMLMLMSVSMSVSDAFQHPISSLSRRPCHQFYHQIFRRTTITPSTISPLTTSTSTMAMTTLASYQQQRKPFLHTVHKLPNHCRMPFTAPFGTIHITPQHHPTTSVTQLHLSTEVLTVDTTTTSATTTTTAIAANADANASDDGEDIHTSTGASGAADTDTTPDIPLPTEKGGFSHTKASKAKISAANKGKVPWNKGKSRSEEVKARIAEGVRRRNRERFLKKLEDMGLTEEEYETQKKEERRKKDAERRKRKTKNGGYRLTEETKQKISKVLKEKHARGEVKKREYKGPFRKGFSHSEETKQKIRESLKKKWAEVRCRYTQYIVFSFCCDMFLVHV